jgi:hypothetical protein
MRRAAFFLTIGVAVAAASTFSYATHAQSSGAPGATGVVAALAARPRGTAERAAFYDAAARADLRAVDALLTQAAALRDQSTRAFALDALLARRAELDAGGAISAAERLQMPATTIAALYHAWLRSAPADALDALDALDDAKAQGVATGLIALIGNDELLVNRVLTVFPPAIADSLVAASLNRVAQDSPAEAFVRAKEIFDSVVRENAMRSVLFAWAERDPLAALDHVDSLDDEALRSSTRAYVLGRLAQRDAQGAMRYFDALDDPAQRETFRSGFWQQLAATAPELVLERAGTFPSEFRLAIEGAALQTLAQRDPDAAIDRLAQTPPGPARQQLVQTIARSLAERDADGALAWVRSLQPPEPAALGVVLSHVAIEDPLRAFELAAGISSPMEQMQALQAVVGTATMRDPGLSGALLDRVLALPNNAQRQSMIQMVMNSWASREPAGAADWLLSNAERAPLDVVTQVGMQYARLDHARAASYADRMPGDARAAWLRGVANGYAAADPRGAFDWVEQFRGRPEYDDTAFAILQTGAQYDPASATRLLESIDREDYRRSGAGMIAMRWASQNPAGAASWAAGQSDPGARMSAVSAVAQLWATQDASAAQTWALSQPSGQARDGALMALVTTAARFDTPDTSLLGAFSTEQARLGAVQGAAMGIAQRNPDDARRFIETHVTEQFHRDRMLSMITQMATLRARGPVNVVSPVSGYFAPGMPVQMIAPGGPTPAGIVDQPGIRTGLGVSVGVRGERVTPAPAPR